MKKALFFQLTALALLLTAIFIPVGQLVSAHELSSPMTEASRDDALGMSDDLDSSAHVLSEAAALTCPTFPYTVPAGNVAELVNAIACANSTPTNDVINLTNSTYTLTASNNTSTGRNGLPVILTAATAGTLTINGNNATIERSTVEGTVTFRLLLVASSANLTLNNLTLMNGRPSTSCGGAVYNLGTLTVNSSAFTSNVAFYSGGALCNTGTLMVSSSSFANNESLNSLAGAISNIGGTATVSSNSLFTGNTANNGGALYNVDGATMTVSDSTLADNSASSSGGAIYNSGSTLTLNNSTLSNNTAENFGGAIYNPGILIVNDSTFSENTISYEGGAIYNSYQLTVNNTTFSENTAGSGGAIENKEQLTVDNSTFSNNVATGSGGAIISTSFASATVSDSTFSSNTSGETAALSAMKAS